MGVFKKGSAWWIDFYHQGKRIRRKVGPSKRVADMALADVQVKKAKNDFLGVCEPKRITFKDFAVEYLEYSKANKAKSSYERDLTIIQKHLAPMVGDLMLSKITVKQMENYKLKRLDEVEPATVNRELNTIKNLFRKAAEWGYLAQSPTADVKRIKTSQQPFRFLSVEEIELLLDACAAAGNPQFYGIVLTALNTGMRKGEILTLRWDKVDMKTGLIQVASGKDAHTKNYESRAIPMNRSLREFLAKHPRRIDTPYVFSGPSGKPFCKTNYHFGRAVKKAGIPHVRVHDLRHTFASQLVMKGIDLRTVQELLEHKDMRMTLKYAHLASDHVRKAVEVLDSPQRDLKPNILDSHYLDTKPPEQENQDAAYQA
jgi:site-specific recombinase XerD